MSKKQINKTITKVVSSKEKAQQLLAERQRRNVGAKTRAVSPHTKLPEDHPESQAVERTLYDMQLSLASHPDKKKENESD